MVLAASTAQAVDAAELVDVDYEPLGVVVDVEDALAPGAVLQFDDVAGNIAHGVRSPEGDVLAGATHVVRARIENQRLAVAPMEGNALLVVPGGPEEDFDVTLHMATQMPHLAQRSVARQLDLPPERVRVVAPHVGGAFGGKAGLPAEHVVLVAAALRVGRPVSWAETRSEAMLSMHGRGQVQFVELGLDSEARITGLRCRVIGDCGAYAGFGGMLAVGPTYTMATGVYDVPALEYAAIAALTNTSPVGAFRGAGRPEAAAMLERVMDLAADQLGLDPAEIRRRNLLPPDAFPHTTLTGASYDTGEYAHALAEALRIADYDALRAEQELRRKRGDVVQLGIGLACYVEITGGGSGEYGAVDVAADGTVTVRAGTSAHGQGHATSFAMIVADRLGVPMTSIRFEQSDTAVVPRGQGTGGSRSLQLGEAPSAAPPTGCSSGAGRSPPGCWRSAPRTSWSRTARSPSAVCPARACPGPRSRSPLRRPVSPWGPSTTTSRRAPPSPSGPTCPWSRSTPRPGWSPRAATSRSTTAAACSTPCWWPASRWAASPRGWLRHCGRSSATTRRATPSPPPSWTTHCPRPPRYPG